MKEIGLSLKAKREENGVTVEEAAEDFANSEDQVYFAEHKIKKVYAITYDALDAEEVRQILSTLQAVLQGRVCEEDEIL